jgi:hypothetical protein
VSLPPLDERLSQSGGHEERARRGAQERASEDRPLCRLGGFRGGLDFIMPSVREQSKPLKNRGLGFFRRKVKKPYSISQRASRRPKERGNAAPNRGILGRVSAQAARGRRGSPDKVKCDT